MFNDGGNDGFWRFQLRSEINGRWIRMYGAVSFDATVPGMEGVQKILGTFEGNMRRGYSQVRVGEGQVIPPGLYEVDSGQIVGIKAILSTPAPDNGGIHQITLKAKDLEVGDVIKGKENDQYGKILSATFNDKTGANDLKIHWADGTEGELSVPGDTNVVAWKKELDLKAKADEARARVDAAKKEMAKPESSGSKDWANDEAWYQQALAEYDANRALMNGDSNAPTDFVPSADLLQTLEGYGFDPKTGFATDKTQSTIVDFKKRKAVLVDINGVKVPFYLSTGHGGKKDVQSRKWYPFFGAEPGTEWLNKGNGKYINDYYGSPELRAMSEWLDANVGDIMDDTSYPYIRSSAKDDSNVDDFTSAVNADTHPIRLDVEGLGNDKMDTLIKANIGDIIKRVRMDPSAEKQENADAPKGGEKVVENLPATMDGEDALSTIRKAAADVAAEDGRYPVARSAEDIEAGAKKQYAGVFDSLKEEYPDLVGEFKNFDDFWDYAKKSLAASTTTRYAESVDQIPPLMKAANRIYARDVLGVDPDGLITFYRNAINNHADVIKAASGYASLDKNMAFNYNSGRDNDGANGRYAIKAKPGQVLGLLGYSGAADEHGVVIGPDVVSVPGRVERLGDLAWTPLNPLMDPEESNTGGNGTGGSAFRHFSTASTFEFPVLDANPFSEGENNNWQDFYANFGLSTGAIPGKYDEIYGEGAFARDFPGQMGIPKYPITRDLFTEKDGKFALDPKKFDEAFKGSNTDLQGRAGDDRDNALKFFDAIQQLSGQTFMTPRGSEAKPEVADKPVDLFAPSPEKIEKLKADEAARKAREPELEAERQKRLDEIVANEAKAGETYRMGHRPPKREDADGSGVAASLDKIDEVFPPEILDPAGQKDYRTGDPVADKETFDIINAIKGNPDAEVTIYRGSPGDVEGILPGDWVTLSPTYAQQHVDSNVPGGKVLSKKVKASDLFTNADSIQEWGYDPEPEKVDAPNETKAPEGVDLEGKRFSEETKAEFRKLADEYIDAKYTALEEARAGARAASRDYFKDKPVEDDDYDKRGQEIRDFEAQYLDRAVAENPNVVSTKAELAKNPIFKDALNLHDANGVALFDKKGTEESYNTSPEEYLLRHVRNKSVANKAEWDEDVMFWDMTTVSADFKDIRTTPEESVEVSSADMKEFLKNSEPTIIIPQATLNKMLEDGRYRTVHETRDSGAHDGETTDSYIDHRLLYESAAYGYSDSTPVELRPVSGVYVGPGGLPEDLIGSYGGKKPAQVVLKNEVRGRTTATIGDSLNTFQAGQSPSSFTMSPDTEAQRATVYRIKTGKNYFETEAFGSQKMVELQVHGGVSVEDIAEVRFYSKPSATIISRLEKLGIPYKIMSES